MNDSQNDPMTRKYPTVEKSLQRAHWRWKWLRLLQHTATIGAVACLLALLLGVAVAFGRVNDRDGVLALAVMSAAAMLVVWMVIAVKVLSESPDRNWLAGKIESANRLLLDRLNTLVFLGKFKEQFVAKSFATRIAKQAREILVRQPARSPFSPVRPLIHLFAFGLLLGATLLVYQRYSPWQKLVAAEKERKLVAEKKKSEPSVPEFNPTENNLVETNRLWGEVRIIDPGRDLQVTQLQMVPLQIEAASSEALKRITWRSAVNDGAEQIHELPAPEDPRYAAYKPEIDLLKLGLSEWDVMTYYAKAETASSNAYASEVYFLEVRPSHEEIERIPGAKSGRGAYNFLKQLTELIQRQQRIVRETYHHAQRAYASPELQTQDRNKLANGETDLSESVEHLAAEMSAAQGKERIAGVLEDLSEARKPLTQASSSLRNSFLDDAQKQERDALQRLVATRKHFRKVVSENPAEFAEEFDPSREDQPLPNQLSLTNKLNQIAEFRNETKAAQDFLVKAAQRQRDVARRTDPRVADTKLALEERDLQQSVERFVNEHPSAFRGLERSSNEAKQALANATEALQKRSRDAQNRTQQAADKLEKFSQDFRTQSANQQLADAHQLKQMLDQEIRALGQCAQSSADIPSSQAHQLANATKGTLSQLKNLAEQPPTRDAFGDPLREALSDRNKGELDTRLSRFDWAETDEARKQAAGVAKQGLEKVSQAFERSLPQGLQAAQKSDALKPPAPDELRSSAAQIEKFLQQLKNDPGKATPEQARQGLEALQSVQQALENLKGANEPLQALLARLEEQLKKPEPSPNSAEFEQLLNELQRFSAEASVSLAAKPDKPKFTDIDAARLPPGYRSRIEKYFQRLSE